MSGRGRVGVFPEGEKSSDGRYCGSPTLRTKFVLIPCDRDHSADEECREGDAENAATGIQNSPAAVNEKPKSVTGAGLRPKEIAARIGARFGRNRIFGVRPTK